MISTRGPHGRPQPLAESLCRTAHRFGPTRMSWPCPRSERAPPAPYPDSLLRVLHPHQNPPLTRQGCTGRAAYRAAGDRQGRANPRSRWPPSPIRPAGGIAPLRLARHPHQRAPAGANRPTVRSASPRGVSALTVPTAQFGNTSTLFLSVSQGLGRSALVATPAGWGYGEGQPLTKAAADTASATPGESPTRRSSVPARA
jgi:hypothetical protein